MKKLIISDNFDPFFNLSLENRLFASSSHDVFYLWRNSDVVVIGRFQNPWKECNLNCMEADKVALMRRDTGGGAVFHDTENLCFTFIGSIEKNPDYRRENSSLVCRALGRLGFAAEPSGRNDIVIDGAKISGSAYREQNGLYIHHGTILVGTDLGRLALYLNPDKRKLISKGVASVCARVTRLKNLNPSINIENVIEVLFAEAAGTSSPAGMSGAKTSDNAAQKVQGIGIDALKSDEFLKTEYQRLKSWDWCYGHSPQFSHTIEERFDWGGIEIHLNIEHARLDNVQVYSDALDTARIDSLQKTLDALRGAAYSTEEIADVLKKSGFADIASAFKK